MHTILISYTLTCSASNNQTLLLFSQLFPQEPDVTVQPELGKNLTLTCVAPESIPPAQVYWAILRKNGFEAINTDARVTMDHEGNIQYSP